MNIIEGGRRFTSDEERRAVMLERSRPELPADQRITQLEAQMAAMQVDYTTFMAQKSQLDDIARFLRDHCAEEIARKEYQHQADAAKAILFYARRERKVPQWARWIVDRFL